MTQAQRTPRPEVLGVQGTHAAQNSGESKLPVGAQPAAFLCALVTGGVGLPLSPGQGRHHPRAAHALPGLQVAESSLRREEHMERAWSVVPGAPQHQSCLISPGQNQGTDPPAPAWLGGLCGAPFLGSPPHRLI